MGQHGSGDASLDNGQEEGHASGDTCYGPCLVIGTSWSRDPLRFQQLKDGSYEFTQQALIDSIIHDVGLKDAKVKPVPAKVSLQLQAFKDEPAFDLKFNYRSAVGKLNYLAQTTRPDIMYATHQIAKYSSDPRQSHGEAILYLVCYLKKTHDLGTQVQA